MSISKSNARLWLNGTTPETVAWYSTDGNAHIPRRFWTYTFYTEDEAAKRREKGTYLFEMPPQPAAETPENEIPSMWQLYYWIQFQATNE